ncbi:MAG: selenium-dependent xanthine dehydrogenase [Clostridiales bacterium]|nr:selenium-dependent xanthine dehydrogenase [Clostridiales bacterium]
MSRFFVNGNLCVCGQNISLLDYLRDILHLSAAKDGCASGACGACMVIVDGEARRACALKTGRLEGKKVLTLEGLPQAEKELYARAFSEAGAVQCGFCTPAMVMSAKALLSKNPNPSPEEIQKALKNNICRCTGYIKIIQAVLLASQWLSQGLPIEAIPASGGLGESLLRAEAQDKAMGQALFAADYYPPRMLVGGVVRSEYPRARVLRIYTKKARALPGVAAVLTAADIPGAKKIGHLKHDYNVLISPGEITHFRGDAIVLIAAENKATLEEAKELVQIDYEPLAPLLNPLDAMKEDAPALHEGGNLLTTQTLKRGQVEQAIAEAAHVVRQHYSLPPSEHAFLEPETALAWLEDEEMHIISGDQGVYQTRKEVAMMLGFPLEQVLVQAAMVGGGFGGKEDMSVQHHAALLAYCTKRPVKLTLSRTESMLVHPKRHAMEIAYTTACDTKGNITAVKVRIVADAGAYASLSLPVLQRACTHAGGPYRIPNVDIEGRAYYTNNPPGGAFRGFGVSQSCFAAESNLNLLAKEAGFDPWQLRKQNAVKPGDVLPNGQIVDEDCAMEEALDAIYPYYAANPQAGLACAIKNSGLGMGINDVGRCLIRIEEGIATAYCGGACLGQGLATVVRQMICEATGLEPSLVRVEAPDTATSPDCGNTTASRQSLFAGEAAWQAALKLKAALRQQGSLDNLAEQEFYGEYMGMTDPLGVDKSNPLSHIAYSYAAHLAELDDEGLVKLVVAAHDSGRIINPLMAEGQVEGGVLMSMGYGLSEDMRLYEGAPQSSFIRLGLLKAADAPKIEIIFVGKSDKSVYNTLPARGAKGLGEIAAIPTAPAIQGAYYKRDGIFRTSLPMTKTIYRK